MSTDSTRAAPDARRYRNQAAQRVLDLQAETAEIHRLMKPLITQTAPGLLGVFGVSHETAARLLVAGGDNPERIRSEAAFANLCGVAPLPASSGKTTRHRLNRGGNRQANHALWRVVFTRMGNDPRTRAYVQRRVAEVGVSLPLVGYDG